MTRLVLHTTSSVAVNVLVRYLTQAGETAALARLCMAETGAGPGDAAGALAPASRISLDLFRQLWLLAAARDPSIGLKVVWLFEPEQMHLVGHIVARCATLGEGLEQWARFARLVCACDVVSVARGPTTACMSYCNMAPDCDLPWLAEHYACLVMAALRRFTPRPQALRKVTFSHAPLVAASVYRARFGCPVEFGAARNTVLFDAQVLDQPLIKADPYLRHFLERQANAELAHLNDALQRSTAHRVRELVVAALQEQKLPQMKHIAATLGLSTDAVRRGLQTDGTQYRQVLDEARRDLARTWLARNMPLAIISEKLGYSEPAVLQRACHRWFGASAGSARRTVKGDLAPLPRAENSES